MHSSQSQRLVSVDAMRGIVMFGLVLVHPFIPAVASLPDGTVRNVLLQQLHHSSWHGLTKADVTFALFVMMLGMMIPFSLRNRAAEETGRHLLYARILRRVALLFLLGVIYNGGVNSAWDEIRWVGVLQRLAALYLFGSVIYLGCPWWFRYLLTPLLLLGYWALLAVVPAPGGLAGDLSFDGNLVAWVDEHFLPGRTYYARWDPEGILSTIPALASCLIGMMWADLLLRPGRPVDHVLWLFVAAAAAVNCGLWWSEVFPFNKPLWTSSYVLVTAGIGSALLGVCHLITDVWNCRRCLFPFIVVGRNLLLAYLVPGLLPLDSLVLRVVGGDVAAALGPFAPWVSALIEASLLWLLLYWLYCNRITVRV